MAYITTNMNADVEFELDASELGIDVHDVDGLVDYITIHVEEKIEEILGDAIDNKVQDAVKDILDSNPKIVTGVDVIQKLIGTDEEIAQQMINDLSSNYRVFHVVLTDYCYYDKYAEAVGIPFGDRGRIREVFRNACKNLDLDMLTSDVDAFIEKRNHAMLKADSDA